MKRFTYRLLILALALLVCLTGIALAENEATRRPRGRNDVATVEYADGNGSEIFPTLEDAIAAAGLDYKGYPLGSTVSLCSDISLDSRLTIDKDVTLDLNGHTITSSGDVLLVAANVTLVDT